MSIGCALCNEPVFDALAGALLWARVEPVCASCIVRLTQNERERRLLEGEGDVEPRGFLGDSASEDNP